MERAPGPQLRADEARHHAAHAARGQPCDCAGHRHTLRSSPKARGIWASLTPLLVCAVCPACLAAYTKLLSLVGISVGLSEFQHALLLVAAITLSLAVSASRSRRMKRSWPLGVACLGSLLVFAGHFGGELHAAEWTGVLILLAGGITEQMRLRRSSQQAVPL